MGKLFYFHASRQPQEAAAPAPERPPADNKPVSSWSDRRIAIYVAALALIILIVLVELARAGGPQYVAGTSYFNAGLAGQPVTWAGGTITYYTDQGDLGPILPGTQADAFVADEFSRWTQISTAAVFVTRGGQLAEDVSGANVILNSDRSITLPTDVQPTAANKPIGIVYDADGAVTDALTDGHFSHALVVLDGRCAETSSALPDLKYHLVRVLGRVLGLGRSQLNLNVITGMPQPNQGDFAGFPIMHEQDLPSCVPVSICYPSPDVPKMDDRALLSRLYLVTSANLFQFPGKLVFAASTGRIHGAVKFTDSIGNPAQPMQGVNVVARCVKVLREATQPRRSRDFCFPGTPEMPLLVTPMRSATATAGSDPLIRPWKALSI